MKSLLCQLSKHLFSAAPRKCKSIFLLKINLTSFQFPTPEIEAAFHFNNKLLLRQLLINTLIYACWLAIIATPIFMIANSGNWRGLFLIPMVATWAMFCSSWATAGLFFPMTIIIFLLNAGIYALGDPPSFFNYILAIYVLAHYLNYHVLTPMIKAAPEITQRAEQSRHA